jgi:hypothetical protein
MINEYAAVGGMKIDGGSPNTGEKTSNISRMFFCVSAHSEERCDVINVSGSVKVVKREKNNV